MSLDATRWAWEQQGLKSAEKLVLLAIADRAGEAMTAHPSVQRLQLDTCLNRKTIIAALDSLEAKGLLMDTEQRVGRTRKVKVYLLVGVNERHNSPKSGTINAFGEKGKAGSNSTETGTIKQSQNRDSSENGTVSGETVPNLPSNGPENGTPKQSQKRYSESTTGESTKEPTPNPPADASGRSDEKSSDNRKPDYQGVVDAYNEILGGLLPEVKLINQARKRLINARWRGRYGKQSRGDDLDFWRRYFGYVLRSKPLCGLKDGFDWSADFNWLMNETNMAKVIEGNYHQGSDLRDDLEQEAA